jgi:hypothetical protein
MTEFFRSDKIAGLITGTFGLVMIVFGAFGLVIVAFQRLVMSASPPNQHASFEHFDEMMRAIQGVFISYLPLMIAGGVVFGVAGIYIYRGSLVARRIAQTNAVVGFGWIIAYMIASYRVMQSMHELPISQSPVFQWASIIVNLIILLAFPAALLYILRHPGPTVPATGSDI